MPFWYPSQQALAAFPPHPMERLKPNNNTMPSPRYPASTLYPIMSVSDRAAKLSEEASRELAKASTKAQQKVGGIELYSPKYYAACTLGGLLACVG